MALTDNLVSYWKLDESSGNAADSVGSNTGTNNGTVTYSTGKINNGAVFNGSSQYFTVGTSLLSNYTALTVAGWVKLDVNNTYMRFVSKTDSSTYNQMIRLTNTGKLVAHVHTTTETTITGSTTLSTGTWYHFAYTYDGSNINLYLNGSTDATQVSKTGTLPTKAQTVNIGRESAGSEYIDGMLDEIGIWSRALSGAEISELYNSGNGLAYPFVTGVDFSISETLALSETSTNLRARLFTTTETLSLSETWSNLKGIGFTIADSLGLVEAYAYTKTHIISIAESLGLIESSSARMGSEKWTNQTKSSSTWTNQDKNNSTWTNLPKS